ncbi:MAG: Gldg family protein [Candidatus Melainabacteria bacterium]|nr:Gldg family protein [Candidatus Melainabacteria bacterium]
MSNILRIARREFAAFFSSVTAFLFIGAFLFVTLFVFFWVDPFFIRNVADARPMFEWMPALLILLVPALTMRMWSEERRSGTLELLMTTPVTDLQLVLGKFLACLGLVAITVALTFQIPLTVCALGELDFGPVFGGYIATLFLAGAYIAIGLYVSARSDNQIVSLLFSIFICAMFLVIGSGPVTNIFSSQVSEILQLIGTGSRFQSITRGVIDFRDIYYYFSIMAIFLSLNVLGLERLRWAGNPSNRRHRQWLAFSTLLIANLIAGNFVLQQVGSARVDITEGQIYTISATTKRYLTELKEPLLIRGYFSKKTHPLLAPLVPRLRDLLNEYAIAGRGKVKVEFIDPLENPELEREAGEKYGIKPVVFQTASKYQAAVVNSYFDVLIKYGDQHETLSFRDLIEVKLSGEQDLDVELRNPEYDITSTIKKVLSAYRSSGNVFLDIKDPVVFKGFISSDTNLPMPLAEFKTKLRTVLDKLQAESRGKFAIEILDPDANGGALAKKLEADYGFRPMSLGLIDPKPFWFYMLLDSKGKVVPVSLPQDLDRVALESTINSSLKRFSRGFLKTVGIWTEIPDVQGFNFNVKAKHFNAIREKLGSEYSVKKASFEAGRVPDDIDVLVLLAPEKMDQKEIFAIDQFLMRGGTVILSTSPFDVDIGEDLTGRRFDSGLTEWLKHNGIEIADSMVLDPKNSAFPLPRERKLGEYVVEETMIVPYPYFVDIRPDAMDKTSGIISGINQLTMTWSSPVTVDEAKNKGNVVTKLLCTSKDSWTSTSTDIHPNFDLDAKLGFEVGKDNGQKVVAVAVEGQFQSFFKGKTAPAEAKAVTLDPDFGQIKNAGPGQNDTAAPGAETQDTSGLHAVADKSTVTSRLVVYASNSFLSDEMLQLASATLGTHYLNPVSLIENTIDWSVGDRELLAIRSRGHFSRPLLPLGSPEQAGFEYFNYGLALLSLFAVWVVRAVFARRARKRWEKILAAKPPVATEKVAP